jgi:arginine/lysine/ornithine decarboxylase
MVKTCCAPMCAMRWKSLGQLLDHNGAIGKSERNAARIFNADHCFFVTNGTSTSNKMVWHHTVAPGDVVVVDRNCHKSNLHAIIMTGAIPVFLKPTRNHFGIIGPIPKSEFEPSRHQAPRSRPTRCCRAWMPMQGQAACPDADAIHLRRRALQHRDHQENAGWLCGEPAL